MPATSSLAGEIEKANLYGLMGGYSDTHFGYQDSMTRVQFLTVLGRMFGWVSPQETGEATLPSALALPDGLSQEYLNAIQCGISNDVIDPLVPFRSIASISRSEMAQMPVRSLGLKGSAAGIIQNYLPFPYLKTNSVYSYYAYTIFMP